MSILVDRDTRLLVQGLGRVGQFYTDLMIEYGTKVVAGTRPGKGGTAYRGIPIYDSAAEAARAHEFNASMIFVPALAAAEAILEGAAAGARLIVAITEGVPALDMARAKEDLGRLHPEVVLIGPNCPGIITPGQCKVGIMPGYIHRPGPVGIMSRSGTLAYEGVHQCSQLGIGQSTGIGIGGDPIVGMNFVDLLPLFARDPETRGILMIGEIGGTAEEEAAAWIAKGFDKPVVAYIAGRKAPPGKRMGHAGAIIAGGKGTAAEKMAALSAAGVTVVESPAELGRAMARALAR
ncbi:MAG: succinate--CoA ligase subunit alpha [Candidatus Eisenbacteria bacterium]|nr:succinate--CoA ligase subunit alpha [Candidatus Eisenbacteria bacterium]